MASSLDTIKIILANKMNIDPKRIWAYNQSVDIPKDGKLFIVLSYGQRLPYYNNRKYKDTINGLEEHQSIGLIEDVIISLISKTTEARDRSHEPLLALNSTFSEYQQEKNQIHITQIGDVTDMSWLEATSRLNRFDVKCKVYKSYEVVDEVDYYDKFSLETWTGEQDGSILINKFNIPKEGNIDGN